MSAEDDGQVSPRSAKGGLAFDVVLEPAQREAPGKLSPRSEKQQLSQDAIERKLREADERREKMERERVEKLKLETDGRIGKIKEKLTTGEVEQAMKQKAELEQDLEGSAGRREAMLREKQEKAKAHEEHAREVRNRKSLLADDPNAPQCCEDGAACK